jgi:two-component system phosphate regulon sensor histidine kinase PhoR
MKNSLFFRILISYIIVILIIAILCLVFLTPFLRSQYLNSKIEELTNLSLILKTELITSFLEQGNWSDLQLFLQNVSEQTKTRFSVILPDGRVVAETLKDVPEMESHMQRPEVKGAFQGETVHMVRYSSTSKEEMLYVASPLFRAETGDLKAVVRLSIFLDEMHDILARLRNIIILITIIMILVATGIAYFISRFVSKKYSILIAELKEGFERVSNGELETRILFQPKEPADLNELVNHFNSMTESLKQQVQDLAQQSEELSATIATIPTGIALVEKEGKIILSNSYFQEMFSPSSRNIENKYFWEVLRDSKLNELVSELLEKKRDFNTELEISGKIYQAKGNYIEKKNKAVLVFYDITPSKKLEQVKKDLITNISHELRTPLTSIKGYVETLEGTGVNAQEREKYLQIIKKNVERLINMVNNLLFLSELENEDKMQLEKVDLQELIINIHKIFEPAFREKNLRFNLNISPNLPKIEADLFKMEQLFINLIDNAVKYTEKGEVTVSISLISNNRVKVEIADTGIGLKKEEINHIFERFYVVNKARSRKEGGTGLGLSIVKHIVLLHKGEIEVDSQPGIGTRIKVILPVQQSQGVIANLNYE